MAVTEQRGESAAGTVVGTASVDDLRLRIKRKSRLKGRQTDETSLAEVRELLGERPADGWPRHRLIEHLHLVNDRYRGLHERHLVALASETNVPMAEVFEVATFYHHFDVRGDGETPPALTVRVCDGLSCEMAGARDLLERLPALLGADVAVIAAPCIGRCEQAPVAVVHQYPVPRADLAAVEAAVRGNRIAHPAGNGDADFAPAELAEQSVSEREADIAPAFVDHASYVAAGGYALAAEVIGGGREPEACAASAAPASRPAASGASFASSRRHA
jgi:formate dehydrogenase